MDNRFEAVLRKAKAMVEEHGWMIQAVGGGSGMPGFSYTVGLSSSFGHPEVFMVGFDPGLCHGLLNDVGGYVRDGMDYSRPCLADRIVRDFDVAFRPVSQSSVDGNSGLGQALLGGPFKAVQMFLPDPAGRFPWEDGCEAAYRDFQTSLLEATDHLPGSAEARNSMI